MGGKKYLKARIDCIKVIMVSPWSSQKNQQRKEFINYMAGFRQLQNRIILSITDIKMKVSVIPGNLMYTI